MLLRHSDNCVEAKAYQLLRVGGGDAFERARLEHLKKRAREAIDGNEPKNKRQALDELLAEVGGVFDIFGASNFTPELRLGSPLISAATGAGLAAFLDDTLVLAAFLLDEGDTASDADQAHFAQAVAAVPCEGQEKGSQVNRRTCQNEYIAQLPDPRRSDGARPW